MDNTSFFTTNSVFSVSSESRIIYTPSSFARSSLVYLQETGTLQATRPHKNERSGLSSYLFFTVLSGSGELIYDGETYAIQSSDCVFIDCKKPYSHETGNNIDQEQQVTTIDFPNLTNKLWSLQWCHFYGPNMGAIYRKYQERGGKPVFQTNQLDTYHRILDELYNIASSPDYVRDMRIHEKLSSLLILLMEDAWDADKRAETSSDTIDIQKVKEYLDANFKEKITLDDLASRFYISKYYLLELFKERYGVTVNAYLNQLRVTYIKQKLRFTDETVERIAEELHIEPTYLSRLFKKMEGVSPSKFRKTWKGSGTASQREERNSETEEEKQKKLHNI